MLDGEAAASIVVAGTRLTYPAPKTMVVSSVMKGNSKRETKPEVRLRSSLHRMGLRFRKNHSIAVEGVTVRPDVVFTRQKLAVFVDGCFWHMCPLHATNPRSNANYWARKLERNVERDRIGDSRLTQAGWTVLRVWEHEEVVDAALRVEQAVRTLRRLSEGGEPKFQGHCLAFNLLEPVVDSDDKVSDRLV